MTVDDRYLDDAFLPLASVRLQSAEIAVRDFARVRRGFDPKAVRKWLGSVARAYAEMEEELARARDERDRLVRVLERTRERPPATALRATLSEMRLKKGLFGYAADDVERLVDEAAAEVSRLETRLAVLEAENAELRSGGASGMRAVVDRLRDELASLRSRLERIDAADLASSASASASAD